MDVLLEAWLIVLIVSMISNSAAINGIAAFTGAAVGARLACRDAVRRYLKKKK